MKKAGDCHKYNGFVRHTKFQSDLRFSLQEHATCAFLGVNAVISVILHFTPQKGHLKEPKIKRG